MIGNTTSARRLPHSTVFSHTIVRTASRIVPNGRSRSRRQTVRVVARTSQSGDLMDGCTSVLQRARLLDREWSHSAFVYLGSQVPRSLLMIFEHAGNGLFWLPGSLALWSFPYLTPVQRVLAANLIAGLVLDVAVVGLLKSIFRRGRPVYNQDDLLTIVSVDKYSFPSGHASRASFIAFFCMACTYSSSPLLAFLILIWGFLTAFSRVVLGRHYLGDVIVGCLIGACVAACICQGSSDPREFLISQRQSNYCFNILTHQLSRITWL